MAATAAAVALVAASAATVALPARADAQSRVELEQFISSRTLPNGLEVIVVENHGVPLVTVELDVRNGAFTQTPEYAGLAHLYEHMFFRANATWPQPGAFLDRAAELGAVFNGTTQEERVNYYLTVPADSVEGAMRFLWAATERPLFLPDELAAERQVVIGEYDRAESSPFFDFQNEMTRALYPGQFSRKNTIGDRRVIQTATPAMMRTIQSKYYVPNNSLLVVSGDVAPERAFALAERIFGGWKRGADPFVADPIPPLPALQKDEVVLMERPVSAVTVMLQWQGPSVGKDRAATYAADVFSDVLNDPGSAFQQRLVDSGLWQGVGVNYYTLNQVGPITISGQTTPDKLKPALAALEAEISRFGDPAYFSADELAAAKAKRAVESAHGAERASGLSHTIGFWWSVADVDYFMGYIDSMAGQTAADLARYGSTYIVGKPRVTGLLLSPEARRQSGVTATELGRAGRVQ
ncbi:MAG TPA: pitrilysin family protein [Gemmatimonadaceae bacterium]|nr:pitrilysin family protein [Gemmatimonadaceae bacterium]